MTTSRGLALLDTNILVYAADHLSPFHAACKELRDRGRRGEVALCLTPQVLVEFYAVVTDPRRVQQPLSPEEARGEIMLYLRDPRMKKIYPGPDIVERVADLIERYGIRRQEIFDALIVATMLSNDVKNIYTYDREGFSRFGEIEILCPTSC